MPCRNPKSDIFLMSSTFEFPCKGTELHFQWWEGRRHPVCNWRSGEKASADLNLKSFRTSHNSGSWCTASISKSRVALFSISDFSLRCSVFVPMDSISGLVQLSRGRFDQAFCKAVPQFELGINLGFPHISMIMPTSPTIPIWEHFPMHSDKYSRKIVFPGQVS